VAPGDHIIVNAGMDTVDDPLVPYFQPRLAALADPPLEDTRFDRADPVAAWGGWAELLRGDGLPLDDPRALIMRIVHDGRTYGSTSASLVGLSRSGVRYDFARTPDRPQWTRILPL
jgi:hypothetical protein